MLKHGRPRPPRSLPHFFEAAETRYLRSVRELLRATHVVEHMDPRRYDPLALRIQSQLRDVFQKAAAEKDEKVQMILHGYAKRNKFSQPMPSRVQRAIYLSEKAYHDTTKTLVKTLDNLQNPSPGVTAHVIHSIRLRLREMANEARSEHDTSLGSILGPYMDVDANKGPTSGAHTKVKGVAVSSSKKKLASSSVQVSPQTRRSKKDNAIQSGKQDNRAAKVSAHVSTEPVDHGKKKRRAPVSDEGILLRPQQEGRLPKRTPQPLNASDQTATKPSATAANNVKPPKPASATTNTANEQHERSLFEELFPGVASPAPPKPVQKREQYPKLELPADSTPLIRKAIVEPRMTLKEQMLESLQKRGEQITVLQLSHCSTGLTETDFSRLVPKSKHIDTWRRTGKFIKVIPGRDPLSLERMPFYFILFEDPASALAYQKNVSRLHKLSALHQASDIFSPVLAPAGFIEDGEDINRATSSYNLLPRHHHVSLNTVMQPYDPGLRALFERGGYNPIAPDTDAKGQRIWKVLMHIEGYEPTPSDLFKTFLRDAYSQGMTLPLRSESSSAVSRLRDLVNLKINPKPVGSVSPRSYHTFDAQEARPAVSTDYEDPMIKALMTGAEEDSSAKELSQYVMNRVYNRWIIEFSDEAAARRFALSWHRKPLPQLDTQPGWKAMEETRMCNTEVLW